MTRYKYTYPITSYEKIEPLLPLEDEELSLFECDGCGMKAEGEDEESLPENWFYTEDSLLLLCATCQVFFIEEDE